MSLEQAIARNNELLERIANALENGASITGGADSSAAVEKTTTTTKAADKKTTSKAADKKTTKKAAEVVDAETLKAKLVEYKNLTDLTTAKALVAKFGFASIADVTDEKSKEVFDAIEQAIVDLDSGNNADEDGEEDL